MDVALLVSGTVLLFTGLALRYRQHSHQPRPVLYAKRKYHASLMPFIESFATEGSSSLDEHFDFPQTKKPYIEKKTGLLLEQNPDEAPIHPQEPDAGQNNLDRVCLRGTGGEKECYWVAQIGDGSEAHAARMLSNARHLFHNIKTYCETNKIFNSLVERHANVAIKESDPPNNGITSFTMEKQIVSLCLRGEDKKLTEWVFLAYVALHELAHVATNDIKNSHSTRFWVNFRVIQVIARAKGWWTPDPNNFKFRYCRNVDVHHIMPEKPDEHSQDYNEIIGDLQKNKPECDSPCHLWIPKYQNGTCKNKILHTILVRLPRDSQGDLEGFNYTSRTW